MFKVIGGIPSNSKSPTDIWILEDAKTGGKYIGKLYVESYKGALIDSAKMLNYEAEVYDEITRKIQPTNLFFVRSRGNIKMSLNALITALSSYQFTSTWELYYNLQKNIEYMINPLSETRDSITQKRPSLTKYVENIKSRMNSYQKANITFRMTITTMDSYTTLDSYFFKVKFDKAILSAMFFAVYCLAKLGINQNDMHWSNILVKKNLFSHYYIYYKKTLFRLNIDSAPVLYDYDRATMKGKENVALKSEPFYQYFGSCVSYNFNRDFLKGICACSKIFEKFPKYRYKAVEFRDEVIPFLGNEGLIKIVNSASTDCWLERVDKAGKYYADSKGELAGTSFQCSDKLLNFMYTEDFLFWILGQTNQSYPIKVINSYHPWYKDIRSLSRTKADALYLVQHEKSDKEDVNRFLDKIFS